MEAILQFLGSATFIAFCITILARFLPNDKLQALGEKLGKILTKFGNLRMGDGYEKLEEYMENSLGVFFRGVRTGLDSDDTQS